MFDFDFTELQSSVLGLLGQVQEEEQTKNPSLKVEDHSWDKHDTEPQSDIVAPIVAAPSSAIMSHNSSGRMIYLPIEIPANEQVDTQQAIHLAVKKLLSSTDIGENEGEMDRLIRKEIQKQVRQAVQEESCNSLPIVEEEGERISSTPKVCSLNGEKGSTKRRSGQSRHHYDDSKQTTKTDVQSSSKDLPARRHTVDEIKIPKQISTRNSKDRPRRSHTDSSNKETPPPRSTRRASYAFDGSNDVMKMVRSEMDGSFNHHHTRTGGRDSTSYDSSGHISRTTEPEGPKIQTSSPAKYSLLGSRLFQKALEGDCSNNDIILDRMNLSSRNISSRKMPTIATSCSEDNEDSLPESKSSQRTRFSIDATVPASPARQAVEIKTIRIKKEDSHTHILERHISSRNVDSKKERGRTKGTPETPTSRAKEGGRSKSRTEREGKSRERRISDRHRKEGNAAPMEDVSKLGKSQRDSRRNVVAAPMEDGSKRDNLRRTRSKSAGADIRTRTRSTREHRTGDRRRKEEGAASTAVEGASKRDRVRRTRSKSAGADARTRTRPAQESKTVDRKWKEEDDTTPIMEDGSRRDGVPNSRSKSAGAEARTRSQSKGNRQDPKESESEPLRRSSSKGAHARRARGSSMEDRRYRHTATTTAGVPELRRRPHHGLKECPKPSGNSQSTLTTVSTSGESSHAHGKQHNLDGSAGGVNRRVVFETI